VHAEVELDIDADRAANWPGGGGEVLDSGD
jgi:hypothetical protein